MPTATDPVAAFHAAVSDKKSLGMSAGEAMRAVAKADPDLHRRYLAAVNRREGRTHAADRLTAEVDASARRSYAETLTRLAPVARATGTPLASGDDVVTIRLTHQQIAALAKQGAELRWNISRANFERCVRSGQPIGLSDQEFRQLMSAVKAGLAASR